MLGNVAMTMTNGSWTRWSAFDDTFALLLLLLCKGLCWLKEEN